VAKKRKKESVIIMHHDDASSSSSSDFSLPLSFENGEAENLLKELAEVGFDKPLDFLSRYHLHRIAQAVNFARSKPAGQIKNMAGFIRYLVQSPGAIPSVKKTEEKKQEGIFRR
jgi:hypothetical protein